MTPDCNVSISYHEVDQFGDSLIDILQLKTWIGNVVHREGCVLDILEFVFCTDAHLLSINQTYLDHDTLTDIITFDYSRENLLSGECYISLERVKENSVIFNQSFEEELHRIMVHGVLHLCGYSDKSAKDKKAMRDREDTYLALRI